MRGKALSTSASCSAMRITPAYAGKSELEPKRRKSPKDHPRLCGEKLIRKRLTIMSLGSPPPMRGKAGYNSRHYDQYRITPAYAGKSLYLKIITGGDEDHPRLCGEKQDMLHALNNLSGSPPPMRGKGKDYQLGDKVSGITPAYAGKSVIFQYTFQAL